MGRKVFITSDMAFDEELEWVASQDPLAALAWPWFLTYLDDWGRGVASASRIRRQVFSAFPYTDADVERWLGLYREAGLILLYEDPATGKRYCAIPTEKWFSYQTHIRSEKRERDGSRCPPPPMDQTEDRAPSAPPAGEASGDAQVRADAEGVARDVAQVRAGARSRAQVRASPSPSPTPSPSPPIEGRADAPPIEGSGTVDSTEVRSSGEPSLRSGSPSERAQPAGTPDGPRPGTTDDTPTNQGVIREFVAEYREIPGISPRQSDYGRIGQLYNEFGPLRLSLALSQLRSSLARGEAIADPIAYVAACCRSSARPRDRPRSRSRYEANLEALERAFGGDVVDSS
jgi:hypothetical protein